MHTYKVKHCFRGSQLSLDPIHILSQSHQILSLLLVLTEAYLRELG